jgi:flavin reductase (DIM6/NTAB) family NADH-FMN oxidoreductase RutF
MRGQQSEIIPRASVEGLHRLMPAAEHVEIESAGHLIATERLDTFNAVLLEFLERRLPRSALSYEDGSDARVLRDALGCFGTGVVVATTLSPSGEPVGLTVNSFTSVSLDPPLVLFCLANNTASLPLFEQASAFALNVLHIGQQPLSTRFAKRGASKFEGTACERWETGAPIVSGSLASIECAPFARHEAGDHVVFIGRVLRARFEPQRDPLLYFRGKYRRLHFI